MLDPDFLVDPWPLFPSLSLPF